MCDTFVVVRPGRVLFAKNSDRDPNEAQVLCTLPATTHAPGSMLKCTWMEIPQSPTTYAVLLSRPFWMWGAEMGANEHGLVIGNEAIFTREANADAGLTGMDLVRLALERASSAAEAVEIIRDLITKYGQGGRCGYENADFRYHNGFLLADSSGAFVLEAAGCRIAVKAIESGAYAISNSISLPELASRGRPLYKLVARASRRRARVQSLAEQADDVATAMQILRDHGSPDAEPAYSRLNGANGAPCMHAGGWLVASQSVGSMVSEMTPESRQHWASGTSAPCLSVFRPVAINRVPASGKPCGTPDQHSLWWRFESLHRRLLAAEPALLADFRRERDLVQGRIFEESAADAWQIADDWLSRWLAGVDRLDNTDPRPRWLRSYWRRIAAQAASGSLMPWRNA